jgi:uncharacterized protein (UPF0332 family)
MLMKRLLDNAEEFLKAGEENLEKRRFNAAVSDFFKAIVIFCDYLIYKQVKILPKNHIERFSLLKVHFNQIYKEVSRLFSLYTKSYNQKLNAKDVLKVKAYANQLKTYIAGK